MFTGTADGSRACSPDCDETAAGSRPSRSGDVRSAAQSEEKDDMVGLNDKFLRLIEKVKQREDENKKLDTKLKILKGQEAHSGKIEDAVKPLQAALKEQTHKLFADQARLEDELLHNQDEAQNNKERYEGEFLKKAELENEFIVAKKDADEAHLEAVHLALELEDLMGQLEFFRLGYDEEIKDLESQIQNQTVIIRDSGKRSQDMNEIVQSVQSQYADAAARTCREAQHWNQKKMDILLPKARRREQQVREVRREINHTLRLLQKLKGELDALERKEKSLKKDIDDTITEGDQSVERARKDVGQLDVALRRAKLDLAGQIREQQALIDLKMALDLEIATYRELLEGEEQRMNQLMRNSDF
ncbi:keratin, type II cytoskeletal 8-like isoform X2 [Syngnathoides biaculeatus]|uniref:keratin, type II cytoskeletal 8-like isoform X2 n=1 Tax=Syngnathoides biaculeatus TaxID=300417 RepID=UPI002ADD345F|nr:keratin, type II cytoskeletal 8-like isoform X2 [Syngnathoides biaculeatus]